MRLSARRDVSVRRCSRVYPNVTGLTVPTPEGTIDRFVPTYFRCPGRCFRTWPARMYRVKRGLRRGRTLGFHGTGIALSLRQILSAEKRGPSATFLFDFYLLCFLRSLERNTFRIDTPTVPTCPVETIFRRTFFRDSSSFPPRSRKESKENCSIRFTSLLFAVRGKVTRRFLCFSFTGATLERFRRP